MKNDIHGNTYWLARLDSDTDVNKQLREDAEMTMQELTTLAQHTSVSLILIQMVLVTIPCSPSLMGCVLVDNVHFSCYLLFVSLKYFVHIYWNVGE